MAPQAFSTGSGGSDDKKDKKGGEDSNKFKDWKKENEKHDDDDDEHDKVKVCHIPPGNEGNAHTIEISESALSAHLGHGDTLGACPEDNDDDDDEPSNIIFIRAITDDNGKTFNIDDFTISINGVVQDLGLPIPIEPNTEKTITGSVPEGYKFVLISGDPSCPVNIDSDTFSLKKGQTIVCTIYYDDLFVPGGVTGPNPTVTLLVNIIDEELGVNPTFEVDGVAASLGTQIELMANKATEITQTDDGVAGDTDPDEEVLPSKITGDGNCPEVLTGTITLSSGQDIECTLQYGLEVEPGVVFHYDTLNFQIAENSEGVGSFGLCQTSGPIPCINFYTESSAFIIVPDTAQPLTDTTLVLANVIDLTIPGGFSGCVVNGIGMDVTTNMKGFILKCPDLSGSIEQHEFNANYALIETG